MKQLNTYIQEGLFDNIGVGYDSIVRNWIEENKFFDPDIKGSYNLNINKDGEIDLTFINRFWWSLFTRFNKKIKVPKFIKFGTIDFGNIEKSCLNFNELNVEDWKSFLPKKVLGEEITYDFDGSNISDADLRILKFDNDSIDEIRFSSCQNIHSFKNLSPIKFNSNTYNQLKINGCENLKTLNGLNITRGNLSTGLCANFFNNPKLEKLDCYIDCDLLYIENTPIGDTIDKYINDNYTGRKLTDKQQIKFDEAIRKFPQFIDVMNSCPNFHEVIFAPSHKQKYNIVRNLLTNKYLLAKIR